MSKSWTSYPPEYIEILENFGRDGGVVLGPFETEGKAKSLRTDLYRFRNSIQAEIKQMIEKGQPAPSHLVDLDEHYRSMTMITGPLDDDGSRFMLYVAKRLVPIFQVPDEEQEGDRRLTTALARICDVPVEKAFRIVTALRASGWTFSRENKEDAQ